jgi:hypothetical protein
MYTRKELHAAQVYSYWRVGMCAGRCADIQPTGFAINRANGQSAPVAVGQPDTGLHTAADLYTATNVYPPAAYDAHTCPADCCTR